MSMLRVNTPMAVRWLVLTSAIWDVASSAKAQYPFGPGFAYSGSDGYGYGYGGPAYPGYGYNPGSVGYGYVGIGVGMVLPGQGAMVGGYSYPMPFGGYGSYGAPGYGPSGIGYANPLFSLGLSPLAVQNAAMERALLRRPDVTIRRVQQPASPAPAPTAPASDGNRAATPPR